MGTATLIPITSEQKIKAVLTEGGLKIVALYLKTGEGLEKHQTNQLLFLQCLYGLPKIILYSYENETEEDTIYLQPGNLLRIEPGRLHAVYAIDQDCRLALHLINPNTIGSADNK